MRIDHPAATLLPASWRASLALGYARAGAATRLVQRAHSGPLRVQKSFYPEGDAVCHNILLHPPAGIAGGDELCIDITAGADSHALLTTPGAAKWYRANGKPAWQRVGIRVGQDARLEWLPQETIFFDATDANLLQEVDLESGARYLGCDILCFGRSASGERFARGTVRQQLQVRQAGRLLWWDQGVLHGGGSSMESPHVLGGATVCATLLAAGRSADSALVAQLRALDPALGVTALKPVLVVRYLGHDAEQARKLMALAWQTLRPHWMDRPATELRIWNT